MKIEIEESPYGDKGATYEGMLGMINHFVLQLKYFRDQLKTPEERAYLEADIEGYEMILKSNSEKNANTFMKLKHQDRLNKKGRIYPNNTALVNHMKATGAWE